MNASIRLSVAVAFIAALVAGCASPIKPATLDKSGARMTHAVVAAKLTNQGGNPRLQGARLSTALAAAFPEQAQRISEGKLEVSLAPAGQGTVLERAKAVPGATHAMAVDATVTSPTTVTPGYYNACAYTTKEGKCQGSMISPTTDYSSVKLRLRVTDLATGKVVFQSDDEASRPVAADDNSEARVTADIARAALRALKETGLF